MEARSKNLHVYLDFWSSYKSGGILITNGEMLKIDTLALLV